MELVIQRLTEMIMELLNEDCNYREDGSFKYIPYNMESFIKLLEGKTGKFLDVGCGIGDKVLMAKELGFDAYGIEKDERLFKIANKYLSNITLIDAMDFQDYDKFEVIYVYRPFKDEEKLKQLSDLIKSKMNPEAILLEV
jgi:SAM-dependent methyltransferase